MKDYESNLAAWDLKKKKNLQIGFHECDKSQFPADLFLSCPI